MSLADRGRSGGSDFFVRTPHGCITSWWGGGGALPYLDYTGILYVPLKRGWFSRSWVLSRVNNQHNFTIILPKSVKTCYERSTFAIPIIFFLNIYFHDFSVKNYLILYAKQNKSGSESNVSCLKQGNEMSTFCLTQGRGLKASAAHLCPKIPWLHPPVIASHL